MEPLKIRYQDFKMQETPATVWKDTFTAYTTTDDADDWFSQVLGQRVELLLAVNNPIVSVKAWDKM